LATTLPRLLLLIAGVFPAIAAAAGAPLRVGVQGIPLTQGNPYRNTFTPNIYTMGAIFDGLTRIDEQGRVQPWLATGWENTGPLTWVLTLREDVMFSNGVPFNAAAVVAVVDFFHSEQAVVEMVARELNFIASARAIDARTVELTTSRPAPLLPRYLPIFYMVEPGQWARLGATGFAAAPVGTGPFKVDAFKPSKIELSAFTESWRKPRVERLEILAIPDASSRAQAVQSGALDVAISIGPEEVNAVERTGGHGISYPGASVWSLNFVDRPGSPFRDRRVRQAVNYAVNRPLLIKALLNDATVPATQPAPRVSFGYNPDLPAIPYDPDTARRLLAEAGYPNGFKFVLQGTVGSSPADGAGYQVVAQDLARIGIDMEIRQITVAELIRNVIEGGWEGDAFAMNYNHEPGIEVLRPLTNHSCLWRRPWYCDQRIMPTIAAAKVAFDPERALALRREVMAFYRNEYASLFLYESPYFAGLSQRTRNVRVVHGFIHFEDIQLAE
jgi:peptide/nickel transport system substrate-binding protein